MLELQTRWLATEFEPTCQREFAMDTSTAVRDTKGIHWCRHVAVLRTRRELPVSREHSRENSRPCPVAVLGTRKHVSTQGNTAGRIRDHVLLPSLGRENTCHLKGTQQGEFETMSCCRPWDEKTRVTSREHSRENSRPCPVAVLRTRKHVSPQGNTAGRIRDHVLLPSLGRENTCHLKGTQQGEFETMSCCRP